ASLLKPVADDSGQGLAALPLLLLCGQGNRGGEEHHLHDQEAFAHRTSRAKGKGNAGGEYPPPEIPVQSNCPLDHLGSGSWRVVAVLPDDVSIPDKKTVYTPASFCCMLLHVAFRALQICSALSFFTPHFSNPFPVFHLSFT